MIRITTAGKFAPTRRAALGVLAVTGAALAIPSLVRARAPRIVTIGGGVTETVFALGRGRDLVAADAASLYPHEAGALPKLSYPKALEAEPLVARRADLLIVDDEAGPKSALDAAASSGAQIVRLPEVKEIGDIANRVRLVAGAVGERTLGDEIADALSADLALVEDGLRHVTTRRRALALLGAPDATVLVTAGRGSTGATALRLAGAENAADGISGWNWLKPADGRELDADAIVSLFNDAAAPIGRVLGAPAVKGTKAARENRIASVNALAFSGFGPRAAHALHAAASKIYPEVRFAALPARHWAEVETAAL